MLSNRMFLSGAIINAASAPAPAPIDSSYYLSYGYFAGGQYVSFSRVDRIDYSNDTVAAVAKGPLSAARFGMGAAGNSSFGYFAGFGKYGSPIGSTVDRVDYSNDTATAVAKGPLSSSRYNPAGTGTSLYGYFGGGSTGSARTTVDRITYASDTATAVAKGPLTSARYSLAATGTLTYGYFGGGGNFPTAFSKVDRIDYSNDTATTIAKGPLGAGRYGPAATGYLLYGYFAGGYTGLGSGTYTSSIYRIDYANDTSTAATKGPLSGPVQFLSGVGTSLYGYFGGGDAPGSMSSRVDRVDYSNDTPTAVSKGPLSLGRFDLASNNHHPL